MESRKPPYSSRGNSPRASYSPPVSPSSSTAHSHDASSSTDASPSSTLPEVCKFFLRGVCNRGSACAFLHPPDLAPLPQKPSKSSDSRSSRHRSTSSSSERGIILTWDGHTGTLKNAAGLKIAIRSVYKTTKSLKEGDEVEFEYGPPSSRGSHTQHSERQAVNVRNTAAIQSSTSAAVSKSDLYNQTPLLAMSAIKPHYLEKQASESWSVAGPQMTGPDAVASNTSSGGSLSTPSLSTTSGTMLLQPAWLKARRIGVGTQTGTTSPVAMTASALSECAQTTNSALSTPPPLTHGGSSTTMIATHVWHNTATPPMLSQGQRAPSTSLLAAALSNPAWLPAPTPLAGDLKAPVPASALSLGTSALLADTSASPRVQSPHQAMTGVVVYDHTSSGSPAGLTSDALGSVGLSFSASSLKSNSKSSLGTLSTNTSGPTNTSGGSSISLLSGWTRSSNTSGQGISAAAQHDIYSSAPSTSSNASSISSNSTHSSSSHSSASSHGARNTPAPRIKKRMNTSTAIQPQQASQTDLTLLGGSMSTLPINKGKKFVNKPAMMRWTANFTGPGCDPTSILLQREDLEALLQQNPLPFAVISELMKIFAHHEFRGNPRMDRILQLVADSPLVRNPRNLRTYIIKLSNVQPPATLLHQENLSNAIDFITDIMERYPQYLDRFGLDVFNISSGKLANAYPATLHSAVTTLIRKGNDLLTQVGALTGQPPGSATQHHGLAFGSPQLPPSSPFGPEADLDDLEEVYEGDGASNDSDEDPDSADEAKTISTSADFRDLPLFPTLEEILEDPEALSRRISKNIVKGRYDNLMHYLDTHFRLLREDAITSIREGIKFYMNNLGSSPLSASPSFSTTDSTRQSPSAPSASSSDVSLYRNVRLTGICPTSVGVVFRVSFQLSSQYNAQDKRKSSAAVDWARTKKLLYGSLICLSPDNFQTLLWATVANRDPALLSTSQEIDVRFPEPHMSMLDPGVTYSMVESNSAYFEAYRHVLTALKNTNIHTFPFLDYLVYCKSQIEAPSYLRQGGNSYYNMSAVFDDNAEAVSFDILDKEWPLAKIQTSMDDSQLAALKHALTSEIAVIQGPPGTGKTFVGLKLMRALLDNRDCRGLAASGPILIVCYTNHALDQFLEGILQFEQSVVRIGSRSKSEQLRDKNLKSLVYESNATSTENTRARRQLIGALKELQEKIEARFMDLSKTSLSSQDLTEVAHDEAQVASLFGGSLGTADEHSVLDAWLGILASELVKTHAQSGASSPVPSGRQPVSLHSTELWPALSRASPSLNQASTSTSLPLSPQSPSQQQQLPSASASPVSSEWIDDLESEDSEDDMQEQAEGFHYQLLDEVFSLKVTQLKSEGALRLTVPPLEEALLASPNLWKVPIADRKKLFLHWLNNYRSSIVAPDLIDMIERYEQLCEQKRVLDQDAQVQVLMSAAVVGLTTTGVAKFQNLIRAAGPPIVVVEEAAEVLEAHIVTALTPSTKHIILIGDHEQLRPSTAVYRLAAKYKLDVSLFERLIKNGVPIKTLSRQRRMRPTISALVNPIYPMLSNHPDVEVYPRVLGVGANVYFVDHTMPEGGDADSLGLSKTNPHEAAFLARLAAHLTLQGYSDKQITILTAYSGQVKLIRQELRVLGLPALYVTSVDNFQGQENDIICLSLVRNNTKGAIGFLNTSNRICVALSRARLGLYIMGSSQLLTSKNQLWATILGSLLQNNAVGTHLTLQCQHHPDRFTKVASVSDFKNAPDGGCNLPCPVTLDCGHPCPHACHIFPHSQVHCRRPCERIHEQCNHRCTRLCFEECADCLVPLPRRLPCGHDVQAPCCDSNPLCQKRVPLTLECGHTIQAFCREINPTSRAARPLSSFVCPSCPAQ